METNRTSTILEGTYFENTLLELFVGASNIRTQGQ